MDLNGLFRNQSSHFKFFVKKVEEIWIFFDLRVAYAMRTYKTRLSNKNKNVKRYNDNLRIGA